MDVRLAKIDGPKFDDVIGLELEEDQIDYLPSNLYSIAESTLSPLFHPRAILLDGKVVGFVMYQFGAVGAFDEGECTIWRFMIDRAMQNKGIGQAAMAIVIEEIKSHGLCDLIDIYYSPKNIAAKKVYSRFGFIETGHRDDGDIIAELKV